MHSQSSFVFAASTLEGCDPLFLAWLAGFVDGEGCITISRERRAGGVISYGPLLVITNTVRAPLDEVAARVGAGTVQVLPRSSPRKTAYAYHLGGPVCRRLVAALAPYLRIKGEQAALLAALEPLPSLGSHADASVRYADLRRPQEALHDRMRVLNGHSTRGRKPADTTMVNDS